jgi:hypothetical protein
MIDAHSLLENLHERLLVGIVWFYRVLLLLAASASENELTPPATFTARQQSGILHDDRCYFCILLTHVLWHSFVVATKPLMPHRGAALQPPRYNLSTTKQRKK